MPYWNIKEEPSSTASNQEVNTQNWHTNGPHSTPSNLTGSLIFIAITKRSMEKGEKSDTSGWSIVMTQCDGFFLRETNKALKKPKAQ